jgi:hypothetical protein
MSAKIRACIPTASKLVCLDIKIPLEPAGRVSKKPGDKMTNKSVGETQVFILLNAPFKTSNEYRTV